MTGDTTSTELIMDISFKCPICDQELEVDASGAGSSIECPSCSNTIMVPAPDPAILVQAAVATPGPPPAKEQKTFSVPAREHAPAEDLIQKPNRPLEVAAKEGDKTLRIKTFKRSDCVEVGKDHFDEKVSAFLEKVGQANIVSINPISYSYMELGSRQILVDYGVAIVFRG
jgi:DNA-directed RNA polymerase subunit RPC12/RpoP